MKLILLSDLHSCPVEGTLIEKKLRQADGVILSGDITGFGSYSICERVIRSVRRLNNAVFAIAGNCDTDEASRALEDYNISLHGRAMKCGDLTLIGVNGVERGGAMFTFFDILENASDFQPLSPLAVITHEPAAGIATAGRRFGSRGNENIRRFIDKHNPVLAVNGHIHEAWGQDKIGKTTFINPGSWAEGRFAEVFLGGDMSCESVEFYTV
ncbi:MAG: metallophosphoesterase family protein [Phycisphaerae bacterium]|jgi:Icc-related predicted phosphoesterase